MIRVAALLVVWTAVARGDVVPNVENELPLVQDSCNECFRSQRSDACKTAVTLLCDQQILSGFTCQRFSVENSTDAVENAIRRLCVPADLVIPDVWSLARFGVWPYFMGVITYFLFVISERVVAYLEKVSEVTLNEDKKGKCTAYVAELVVTTVVLVVVIAKVDWVALVVDDYWGSADNLRQVAFSTLEALVFSASALMMLYIMELGWNRENMQMSLKMHHICTLLFALVEFIVIGTVKNEILAYLRVYVLFVLYAATEQVVYAFMLVYRFSQTRYRNLLKFLAVSFIATRVIIFGMHVYAITQAFIDFGRRPMPAEEVPQAVVSVVLYFPTMIAVTYAHSVSSRNVWKIANRTQTQASSIQLKP